jgi:cellulose synthase/poly-beta-1,6-N-acetylglucosamine synthase-like glycosyltransferase
LTTTLATVLAVCFWAGAALVLYVYAGYPLCLGALAILRRRGWKRSEERLPTVSMTMAAYNEAEVIEEKILNFLRLDYPPEKAELLIGSDASDDGTDQIIQRYVGSRVRLFRQPVRTGKTAILNRLVTESRGEIVIFCDANSLYAPDAIRKLVRNFADPKIGFVTGYQRYADEGSSEVGSSESLYWRYEMAIRRLESAVGSMVGADGAIYALRRELYRPLEPDDLNDFVNPIQAVLQGWRGIFEPEAVCDEATSGDFRGEFYRKMRIANRGWRALIRLRAALNPFRTGLFAWQLLSHKALRWLVPFFLPVLFGTNAALALLEPQPVYVAALALQASGYGLALAGWLNVGCCRRWSLFYVPYYFCLVNAAAGIGVSLALLGRTFRTWQPLRGERKLRTKLDSDPSAVAAAGAK